jgi:hypothetical protein
MKVFVKVFGRGGQGPTAPPRMGLRPIFTLLAMSLWLMASPNPLQGVGRGV